MPCGGRVHELVGWIRPPGPPASAGSVGWVATMSYPPYDPGGWEPPLPADWFEQPENWGSSAAPQGRELVPSGELGLPLPPPGQLQEWLAAIVQRDGLEALLSALLRAVAREDFMAATEKLCNIQWGEEPLFSTETGAVSELPCMLPRAFSLRLLCLAWQARWESPRASPARSTTSTVDTIALPSTPSNTGEVPSLFRFKRCWHCEPAFGRADEICHAQEVLGSLEAEAEEQDEEVLQAEVVPSPPPPSPRSQRVPSPPSSPRSGLWHLPRGRAARCLAGRRGFTAGPARRAVLPLPQVGILGAWQAGEACARAHSAVCD